MFNIRVMGSTSEKIYCAFCKLDRKVYTKKSVTWTNVLMCAFLTLLIGQVVWQEVNPKMTVVFIIFVCLSEVFVRLRWRMGLSCPHCGFDPVIYKTDQQEAVRRVKAHLDLLKNSGRMLLKSRNPLSHLPFRKKLSSGVAYSILSKPDLTEDKSRSLPLR